MPDDNLLEVYKQLNAGYHAVDDFRAKLLGFLPLASGAAFIALLSPDKANGIAPYMTEIGLLGSLITFGLLVYELKGIKKCTDFIFSGRAIEEKWLNDPSLTGKFSELSRHETWKWQYATEPVASAIVYATVMAGWMYVATCQKLVEGKIMIRSDNTLPSTITWVIVFAIVIIFWKGYKHHRNSKSEKPKSSKENNGE